MAKAIALYSGGLDSILAILTVLKQGVSVSALTFLTRIGCGVSAEGPASRGLHEKAKDHGFSLQLRDLSDKFLDIVKRPKHGYGKNMNPCLDCKILMLREAKEEMTAQGADFVVTGEVLWQRPMSQRRDTFPVIDREAGLDGLILRPLSAKLLKPTIPEERGLIDREKLHGFSGRGRKPQMALAADFGLTDYPQPAGGCLLTDPIYSARLRDLLGRNPAATMTDLALLRTGRHFRVSGDTEILVGRDERDNDALMGLAGASDYVLSVDGFGSPATLVRGAVTDDVLMLAASICARYSDAKGLPTVAVTVQQGGHTRVVTVAPIRDIDLDAYRPQH